MYVAAKKHNTSISTRGADLIGTYIPLSVNQLRKRTKLVVGSYLVQGVGFLNRKPPRILLIYVYFNYRRINW